MLLVERSGFGLNELLGGTAANGKLPTDTNILAVLESARGDDRPIAGQGRAMPLPRGANNETFPERTRDYPLRCSGAGANSRKRQNAAAAAGCGASGVELTVGRAE